MSEKKSELDVFIENMNASATKIQQMKEEVQNLAQEEFKKSMREIFILIPSLKAIAWTQYSPHFNDGDECVFGVNSVAALSFIPSRTAYDYEELLQEMDEDDEGIPENAYAISDYSSFNENALNKNELAAIKNVLNFIETNEELMQDLYGNHVEVIFSQDDLQVNDYDHD